MSYRRADNEAYRGVVDQLKSDLSGRFEAETGRGLTIFVDRDDIGWGEDWRQKIFESIRSAIILLPIITMRYFESEACREEFMAFYEDAKQIGVTDLIMPIVLAGRSRISADSPREEMRIVHGLQHIPIEEAFAEGFDSPQWNKTIGRMVNELADAVERAESKLEGRELRSTQNSSNGATNVEEITEYADLQDLQERISGVDELTDTAKARMDAVMEVIDPILDAGFWEQSTQRQKFQLLGAANALRVPGAEFAQATAKLEEHIAGIDSGLRLVIDELKSMESQQARQLIDSLIGSQSRSSEYEEILEMMPTISDGLRLLSMTSINLRKAIGPVIRGFQSMQRAAEIFDGWTRLQND